MAEVLGQTIGIAAACDALGVPRSTLYRRRESVEPAVSRRAPPRSLSQEEQATVRSVLNSERFRNETPRQVYATLLDEGVTGSTSFDNKH